METPLSSTDFHPVYRKIRIYRADISNSDPVFSDGWRNTSGKIIESRATWPESRVDVDGATLIRQRAAWLACRRVRGDREPNAPRPSV